MKRGLISPIRQGRFWSTFVKTTAAAGMTPPVRSLTTPRSVAVWVWARAGGTSTSATAAIQRSARMRMGHTVKARRQITMGIVCALAPA
jgi:hypothetical protein